jgi:TolB protein
MIVIGAVTVLALILLVVSILLGIRAGQSQFEIRRRQQVGIALQSAMDLRAEGNAQAALAEYQQVLLLDPDNPAAAEGVQSMLASAPGTVAAVPSPAALPSAAVSTSGDSSALLKPQAALQVTPTSAVPVLSPSASALSTPFAGTSSEALAQAQTSFRAGRWQATIDLLEPLQAQSTSALDPAVTALLFDAYVSFAIEKDNEDNLESALTLYDRALDLRVDPVVQQERDLVELYLEAQTYEGVDWERTVAVLTQIYSQEPQYRDVQSRLLPALMAYGDQLAIDSDWCGAVEQYDAASALLPSAETQLRTDQARAGCSGTPIARPIAAVALTPGLQTPSPLTATLEATLPGSAMTATLAAPLAVAAETQPASTALLTGRILYSALDLVDGRNLVFSQPAAGGLVSVALEDGAQPALRADGVRIAYRNTRTDQGGISATDPSTGIFFRITNYSEDIHPTWDPGAGRVAFASNREGDRRWRIYVAWAEEQGDVVMIGFGESPAWHPYTDLIAHRGCDATGNSCGIWLMDGSGADRSPLTKVAADNRPSWSPDGRFVVFQSDGRDGNQEIYRVDSATGQVLRLTSNPALDIVPSVSPDGQWVAFLSNRDGSWKIWAVPSSGGAERQIAALKGDLGDWNTQGLQWVD